MFVENDTATKEITTPAMETTTSESIRNVLFIGKSGIEVCEGLVGFDYSGFSLPSFSKAYYWLENQLLAGNELPSVIICDFVIDGRNVFSFYDKISGNRFFKTIPFIVLAEKATQQDKNRAMKAGIDDFYTGEFNAEDIRDRVDFLKRFKKELMNFEPVPQLTMNHFVPLIRMPLLKRLADIILSLSALIILSPVLLLIAFLIKLESKGPVFYSQKRAGKGYRIFDFYKFRSMRVGADAELQNLLHLNQYNQENGKTSAFVKIENDPRITKIGHFLRNTSLDEIPQLFNVLKGDMSLVGNRPLPLYEAELLTRDQWARRFLAPAGITGLWQVTKRGRGEMSEEERIELDVAYADKSSFWFDLVIMARTVPALFQKENV